MSKLYVYPPHSTPKCDWAFKNFVLNGEERKEMENREMFLKTEG